MAITKHSAYVVLPGMTTPMMAHTHRGMGL